MLGYQHMNTSIVVYTVLIPTLRLETEQYAVQYKLYIYMNCFVLNYGMIVSGTTRVSSAVFFFPPSDMAGNISQ